MKKYRRILIIVLASIFLLAGVGILLYTMLVDEK